MKKSLLTLTLLAAVLYADESATLDNVRQTGEKATALLIKTLGSNLKQRLQTGGPTAALDFCADKATELTGEVDEALGANVSVKRISLRYRNPGNAPQGREKIILEAMQRLQESGVVLPGEMIEKSDNGVYKYYKPLLINKGVCLKCHGDLGNTPDLAAKIRTYYPDDHAVGYTMQDLRGAVVVTVKP